MFDFKNKKSRICFIGMLISFAILLIVFYATDGLLGDKELREQNFLFLTTTNLSVLVVGVDRKMDYGFLLKNMI